eukprot:TRINITY_DN12918_c0_g1_i2.p1 TRINITY_DN12918_c0_g1~~TRINITY_DN12918_c0_g1_i2.p1  ORF type:complete len:170 (-),score=30.69 TRINITY_DN12918_c0_g1_i2:261-770(-)
MFILVMSVTTVCGVCVCCCIIEYIHYSGCMSCCVFFFFFKQKTAYEMLRSLVGSEMCIRDRFKGSEKLSETTFAGQLKSESEMLSHEEPDQSGKPPVACRAKYNRVVKNMLNQVELSPTRPKTSGRTSAMGLGGLGLGVVRDRSGQAAVKVHNAWITRFNSRPQTVPMR